MKIMQVRLPKGEIEGGHTGYYQYEFCTFCHESPYDSNVTKVNFWHNLPEGLDNETYNEYEDIGEDTRYMFSVHKTEVKLIGDV